MLKRPTVILTNGIRFVWEIKTDKLRNAQKHHSFSDYWLDMSIFTKNAKITPWEKKQNKTKKRKIIIGVCRHQALLDKWVTT